MTLAQGDIVFVGYDAKNWDHFIVLATCNIGVGEVVHITPSDWEGRKGAFSDTSNYLEWTVPAGGIQSGQTIVFSKHDDGTWRTSAPDNDNSHQFGTPSKVGDVNIEGQTNGIKNEELFLFQDDPRNPTLISGLITNTYSTDIPRGLTKTTGLVDVTQTTANATGHTKYYGGTMGTKAELLAAIGDASNWGQEVGASKKVQATAPISEKSKPLDGTDLLNTTFDIICFTPGVLITTPTGQTPIEHLKVGDFVVTADNDIQPIRWIGSKKLSGARLHACDHLRPVKISAGSLGNDLPQNDMWVSPQHRMLVNDPIAQALFGHTETLSPARGLVNGTNIITDRSVTTVEYIHLLFDTHQVIFANGAPTESFHPSKASINGLTETARNEVLTLFPELRNDTSYFGAAARPSLSIGQRQIVTTERIGYRPASTPITHVW